MNTPIKQNTVDLQTILGIVEALPDVGANYPDIYDGVCEVTPAVKEQTLATANKVVPSDITVHKIPFSKTDTANTNGKTVSIG